MIRVITNPDTEFVHNKKKAIKDNGNYCVGCPKIPEWHCKGNHYCKVFTEMQSGWCPEGLYEKIEVEDNEDVQ